MRARLRQGSCATTLKREREREREKRLAFLLLGEAFFAKGGRGVASIQFKIRIIFYAFLNGPVPVTLIFIQQCAAGFIKNEVYCLARIPRTATFHTGTWQRARADRKKRRLSFLRR